MADGIGGKGIFNLLPASMCHGRKMLFVLTSIYVCMQINHDRCHTRALSIDRYHEWTDRSQRRQD